MYSVGEIYKITNTINGKVYIGQTAYNHLVRWETHIQDFYNLKDSILYRAMRKHGVENFVIERLEECENEYLDAKEIYYIQKHNSYKEGYNATLGGGGQRHDPFDGEKVLALWAEGLNLTDISGATKNNIQTIRDFLCSSGVPDIDLFYRGKRVSVRQVCCIDFKTREILEVYPSIKEAGEALGRSLASIGLTCQGRKESAHGYFWRYWEEVSQEDKAWMNYSGDMPNPPKEEIDRETVFKMYQDGACANSIAGQLNVSRGYVYHILREAGIKRARHPNSRKVIQLDAKAGEYIACYYSAKDAVEDHKGHRGHTSVSKAANSGTLAYGFRWKWCDVARCEDCTY